MRAAGDSLASYCKLDGSETSARLHDARGDRGAARRLLVVYQLSYYPTILLSHYPHSYLLGCILLPESQKLALCFKFQESTLFLFSRRPHTRHGDFQAGYVTNKQPCITEA